MLTLSRHPDGDGYHLAGSFGTLVINTREPLSQPAAERYLRLFTAPDEPLTVDLPAGDPLADLGR